VKTLILPALNEVDLDELPEEFRREMTIVPAETIDQVIKVAIDEKAH
jgi:ATP-dependent Lon protease